MPAKGSRKGKKNNDYSTVVDEFNACCPKCAGESIRLVRFVRRQDFGGKAPNGEVYSWIEWRRMKCDGCHQTFMKRTYKIKSVQPEDTNDSAA